MRGQPLTAHRPSEVIAFMVGGSAGKIVGVWGLAISVMTTRFQNVFRANECADVHPIE